jgi:hypothetical protein
MVTQRGQKGAVFFSLVLPRRHDAVDVRFGLIIMPVKAIWIKGYSPDGIPQEVVSAASCGTLYSLRGS